MKWLKKTITKDEQAKYFFDIFRFEDGTCLTEKRQKEYLANAEILNAIKSLLNINKATKKYKKRKFWELISEGISSLEGSNHSLPKNIRRLREKYLDYITDGYHSLIHKSYGNQNSRKVNLSIRDLILSIQKQYSTKNSEKIHLIYEEFFLNKTEITHYNSNALIRKDNFSNYVKLSPSTIENYINYKPEDLISEISFDKMEWDLINEFYTNLSSLDQKRRIEFMRIFLEILKQKVN